MMGKQMDSHVDGISDDVFGSPKVTTPSALILMDRNLNKVNM